MNKQIVQSLFGANADAYVTSLVHAKGASLNRLVELLISYWETPNVFVKNGRRRPRTRLN